MPPRQRPTPRAPLRPGRRPYRLARSPLVTHRPMHALATVRTPAALHRPPPRRAPASQSGGLTKYGASARPWSSSCAAAAVHRVWKWSPPCAAAVVHRVQLWLASMERAAGLHLPRPWVAYLHPARHPAPGSYALRSARISGPRRALPYSHLRPPAEVLPYHALHRQRPSPAARTASGATPHRPLSCSIFVHQ